MTSDSRVARAYDTICRTLEVKYPEICGGLLFRSAREAELIGYAHDVVSYLLAGRGEDALEHVVEAFARTSFEFIRLQSRFVRTGRYRASDPKAVAEGLYADKDRMLGYYLDGLLMTYALWPHHTTIYKFFLTRFLPTVGTTGDLLEVGVGHGLMAMAALQRGSAIRYTGVDISPTSLSYTQDMMRAHAIQPERANLYIADVCDDAAFLSATSSHPDAWDAGLCCEVLEHVAEPRNLLHSLRRRLRYNGRLFVTTVANLEAEDHVYLYDDEEHIRHDLTETGFVIDSELVLPLPGYENARMRPLNYAAILRVAER